MLAIAPEIKNKIGSGAFGDVYEGLFHGTRVAVKKSSLGDSTGILLEKEISIICKLNHDNIVPYLGVYEDNDGKACLVMEYVPFCFSNKLQEPRYEPWKALRDVARALQYLHSQDIYHRDVKPQNVLITKSGHAKLADFGISRISPTLATLYFQKKLTICGTEGFAAPEILQQVYDHRVDIFSYGEMLRGVLAIKRALLKQEEITQLNSLWSRCKATNPSHRPFITEIIQVWDTILPNTALTHLHVVYRDRGTSIACQNNETVKVVQERVAAWLGGHWTADMVQLYTIRPAKQLESNRVLANYSLRSNQDVYVTENTTRGMVSLVTTSVKQL